jgi:hypothetical protein
MLSCRRSRERLILVSMVAIIEKVYGKILMEKKRSNNTIKGDSMCSLKSFTFPSKKFSYDQKEKIIQQLKANHEAFIRST